MSIFRMCRLPRQLSLAELTGGVIEMSKSSGAGASSATPAQGAGTTFFIGDEDAKDKQPTANEPDTKASACDLGTEAARKIQDAG